MKSPEQNEGQGHTQAQELGQRLLTGEIKASEFLDKIFEIDQSTPNRENAATNLHVLIDEKIANILKETDPTEYYNILSLSYFHVGQITEQNNPGESKIYYEKALESARQIDNPQFRDWQLYIEGTLSYINNDVLALEAVHTQMEDGANRDIIANMIRGLKMRGDVD